jgi:HemY protein
VTIQTGEWVVRMNLVLAGVLALGISFAVFRLGGLLWRLLTARRRLGQWRAARARRRGHESLAAGLLALAAGEPARAERLLARASGPDAGVMHFLAAAQAAHAQQAADRRDRYLALARDAAPSAALPIALQQIEMQLAAGELAAAAQGLDTLAATHPTHRQVLALRHRCLAARHAWDDVAALLPDLRRHARYPAQQLMELEAECATRVLARPFATREALARAWESLPRPVQSIPVVKTAYARVLIGLGAEADAEKVLRRALDAQWDARLVACYGEIAVGAAAAGALRHAERWLPAHRGDPALLLALGRLCHAQGLWGKARSYFEQTLSLAPSAQLHRMLADTLERLGEGDAAARQRRLGLDVATSPVNGPAALT